MPADVVINGAPSPMTKSPSAAEVRPVTSVCVLLEASTVTVDQAVPFQRRTAYGTVVPASTFEDGYRNSVVVLNVAVPLARVMVK